VVRQQASATLRNREPILAVLRRVLPARGTVLEVAAGSGEHAVFFAAAFPQLVWQPSDIDPEAMASIHAWREHAGVENLLPPLLLDVTSPSWPVAGAEAVVCINMIHIAPWQACLSLLAGAARLLAPGAVLYLYGPYLVEGIATAASNLAFDQSLRARNPSWGVRWQHEVEAAAAERGFSLEQVIEMPANNRSLVFLRGVER
jgi:hypothetical protein